ncbi:MAG: hypothetical protein HKO85_10135 [Xanthomonadales bacterium]|nr:hypothetical protein [Gammaproteobacteria bacterium]MBT8052163.1 hypothetical protein [Gammaproteobacteria bacterium]MBT8056848.1 hypothetical protein [Gammaproteobacteria bacterium]NNJ79498.1 hypothetical protein [Xanthomonadales bacterium]NNL05636.1 hypothetical protein [Xanthomonadales bacterium]
MHRRLVLLALALLTAACSPPLTVSQQIIHAIREMEARIEAGERREFMEFIADDFSAQNERMNRDQVRALVVFQLRRYERLNGQLFPISVTETAPDTAEARFRALITGGPGWIPDSGQVYDFETWWRFEDGDWLLTSANWDEVPLDEVLDDIPLPTPDR